MKSKIVQASLVLLLICFSFYYTDRAVDLVKKKDPIMKEILRRKDEYQISPTEAIVDDDSIIPGKNGNFVNVDASFSKMKKLGEFNDSLLVFDEVFPNVTLKKNYDKFIFRGNNIKNNISLLFLVEKKDRIEDILAILKEKNVKVTFFLDGFLLNDNNLLKKILADGHELEVFSYNGSFTKDDMIVTISKLETLKNSKAKYCYSEFKDSNVLDICSKQKMHTIIPSMVIKNYLYKNVRENIDNGVILSISNLENVVNELSVSINYVKQKGFNIVTLSELLSEKNN